MALAIEGVRYFLAAYVLAVTGYSLWCIYITTKINFVNDNAWVSKKGLNLDNERDPLRAVYRVVQNVSIAFVVFNFFIIAYLIFSKFRVGTRF